MENKTENSDNQSFNEWRAYIQAESNSNKHELTAADYKKKDFTPNYLFIPAA